MAFLLEERMKKTKMMTMKMMTWTIFWNKCKRTA